jgi:hypothetical protein
VRRHKRKKPLIIYRRKGTDYFTTDLKEAVLRAIELVNVAQGGEY